MRRKYFLVQFIFLALCLFVACKNEESSLSPEQMLKSIQEQLSSSDTITVDKTINFKTGYNNLFLDSNDVKSFMLKNTEFEPFARDMIGFYKGRNFQYAWFDSTGMIEQASNFINVLNNNQALSKDSTLIDKKMFSLYKQFANRDSVANIKTLLEAELRLTGQFFKFAQGTYGGKNLDISELGWFIPRKKLNFNELFNATVKSQNVEAERLFMNPIYKKLHDELVKYSALKELPWENISIGGAKLSVADSSTVLKLKGRLALLGDMLAADVNEVYDSTLVSAIKSYQRRFGMNVTGVADKSFFKSINTPVDTLIKKILINQERAKWMPAQLPETYAWVNIPEYKLNVYENNQRSFDMKVVVGSQANNTVIFTDIMEYVVFAPYWGVPTSIVKKEIMPALARGGKGYLERNNMEITGYNGKIPIIRQKPGPKNSLGLVKFLFPNSYNIYFHDTPGKWAFAQGNRSLSHGCIRLQDPAKFAKWVLRYNAKKYTPQYIDSMMHKNTKESYIKIDKQYRFPVFLIYFTAWVDDDGKLNFRPDIYKHDKKMADKLIL